MKTKIIITSMICSLFFGCATHGLTHQQLIDTQKLLLKSKDKNKLIAFYRNHLDEESQFKVELIKIYLEQKDLESAKIYIDTLDKEQKNDFRINALLASYYYSINDIENAKLKIDAAKEKVQSRVDKSELFALSGKIYIANNELELAKKDLKKALEFGYDQSIIKNNLAIIAIKGNDLNKAFDLLSSEYQLNTDDKDIATNLALVLIKTKHPNKAKTILMKTFGEIKGVEYFNRLTAKKHTEPTIKTKPLSNHITTMKPASSPKQYIDLTGQYEVQVIAKLNTLTDADKYFLKSISKDWLVFEVDHVKKYCLGPYSDMNSAKNAAEQIDIEGAFVVNYGSIPYKELHL